MSIFPNSKCHRPPYISLMYIYFYFIKLSVSKAIMTIPCSSIDTKELNSMTIIYRKTPLVLFFDIQTFHCHLANNQPRLIVVYLYSIIRLYWRMKIEECYEIIEFVNGKPNSIALKILLIHIPNTNRLAYRL